MQNFVHPLWLSNLAMRGIRSAKRPLLIPADLPLAAVVLSTDYHYTPFFFPLVIAFFFLVPSFFTINGLFFVSFIAVTSHIRRDSS